jgi:hypothetical protein
MWDGVIVIYVNRIVLFIITLGALLAVLCQCGCRCQDPKVLATLTEKKGAIERDFAKSIRQWQAAEISGEYRLGDGIRSKSESEAVLSLNEGSKLRLASNSQLRFLTVDTVQGKSGQGIDIETGSAELVVGDAEFSLLTSVGTATIASGSVLRLKKSDDGIAFQVEIGKATFFDKNAVATEIAAGKGIKVNIGSAVLEKYSLAPEVDTAPDRGQESPPPPADTDKEDSNQAPEVEIERDEAASRSGDGDHESRSKIHSDLPFGPEKVDFKVSAGASFVVHAPSPPIAVSFDTAGKCSEGTAAIQIGKRWISQGTNTVNALFEAGHYKYRLRCLASDNRLGAEIGKGKIHVLKDAGIARLPGNPPKSFVETDGRLYKILYQTRQPAIEVRWPRAPKGQKYKLHIDGKRKIATTKPLHTLSSGSLSEGVHQIKFEAIGTLARTSRTTTIQIRFDNAAPKASLTSPANGSFGPGSTVQVRGTAMARWNVKLLGGSIEKDAQHRFSGEVAYSGVYLSVVLRLSHPKRGVHYYIRRARGQAP